MNYKKKISFSGFLGRLSEVFAINSTAAILLMMVISLIGFHFRILRFSLTGVTEGIEFFVLIGIFLGFPLVEHRKKHIKMELLTPIFPFWLKIAVSAFSNFLAFVFFTAIFYGGLLSTIEAYIMGEYEVGLEIVPLWVVRAFIPLGSLLVILVSVANLVQDIAIMIKKEGVDHSKVKD
jgi:TRAP-type C4-dicarboxylate transport system permease small subunit